MLDDPERKMATKTRDNRNAERGEGPPTKPLGSRIRARFVGIGLDEDLPQLRGEPARPATVE